MVKKIGKSSAICSKESFNIFKILKITKLHIQVSQLKFAPSKISKFQKNVKTGQF